MKKRSSHKRISSKAQDLIEIYAKQLTKEIGEVVYHSDAIIRAIEPLIKNKNDK